MAVWISIFDIRWPHGYQIWIKPNQYIANFWQACQPTTTFGNFVNFWQSCQILPTRGNVVNFWPVRPAVNLFLDAQIRNLFFFRKFLNFDQFFDLVIS